MSESLAELFVLLRAETAGFTGPLLEAAKAAEAAAARIVESAARINASMTEIATGTERMAAQVTLAEGEAAKAAESAQLRVSAAAEGAATKVSTASAEQARAVEGAAAKTKVAAAEQATVMETAATRAKAAEKTILDTSVSSSSGVQALASKSGLAFAGLAAVVGYESIKMAGDFQQASTKLVTSAGEDATALENIVKPGVLAMTGRLGVSADDLVKALYPINSAGYHGAAGLGVLETAEKGAKAEGADGVKVADALTSALHDYYPSAKSAADVTKDSTVVMSAFLGATSQGKMTFDELAGGLNNILPIAAKYKLSLQDVLGVLASMTSHGISVQQATENEAHAIDKLSGQGTQSMREWAKVIGTSMQEINSTMQTKGLAGTLEMIDGKIKGQMGPDAVKVFTSIGNAVKGSDSTVQQLFASLSSGEISYGNFKKSVKDLTEQEKAQIMPTLTLLDAQQQLNGKQTTGADVVSNYGAMWKNVTGDLTTAKVAAFAVGENTDYTNESIKKIGDSMDNGKALTEAWVHVQDNFNQKMSEASAAVGSLFIEIGTNLLPVLTPVVAAFGDFATWLGQNKDIANGLAMVIGGVLVIALGALTLKMVAAVLRPTASLLKGAVAVAKWAGDMVLKFTGVTRAAELSASQRELADRNAAAAAEEAATQETTAAERAATAMQGAATKMSEAADRISVALEGTAVKAQAAAREIEVAEQELITETATKTVDLEAQMGKRKLAYDGVVRAAQTSATEVEAADRRAVAAIETEAAQTEAAAARIKVAYEEVGAQAGLSRDKVVIADREASAANDAEAMSARGAGAAKGRGGAGGAVGGLLLGGMAASAIDSAMPTDPVSKSIEMSSGPVAANHAFGQLANLDFSGFWKDLVAQADGSTAKAAAVAIQNAKKMKDGTATQLSGLVSDAATKTAAWAKNIADKTADGARAGINNVGLFKNGTTAGLTTAVSDAASKAAQWAKTIADHTAAGAAKSKSSVDGMRVGVGAALGGMVADTAGHMTGFSGSVDAKTSLARQLAKDRTDGMRSDVGGGLSATVGDAVGHMTRFTGAIGTGMSNSTQKTGQFPGDARASLGDTGSILYAAGQAVMQGLLNGLKSLWGNITSFVGGIASWIASNKGPIEVDRQLLVPHGNAIMDGLHEGLQQGHRRVRGLVSSIAGSIAGQFGASGANIPLSASVAGVSIARAAALTSQAGGGGSGGDIHVHINAAGSILTDQDLARMIQEWLLRYGVRNSGSGITYSGFGAGR